MPKRNVAKAGRPNRQTPIEPIVITKQSAKVTGAKAVRWAIAATLVLGIIYLVLHESKPDITDFTLGNNSLAVGEFLE